MELKQASSLSSTVYSIFLRYFQYLLVNGSVLGEQRWHTQHLATLPPWLPSLPGETRSCPEVAPQQVGWDAARPVPQASSPAPPRAPRPVAATTCGLAPERGLALSIRNLQVVWGSQEQRLSRGFGIQTQGHLVSLSLKHRLGCLVWRLKNKLSGLVWRLRNKDPVVFQH